MEGVLFIARVLLAGVFLVAGVAKLADRRGGRTALSDFGVPDLLAAPLAVMLPLVEVLIAVALLPDASASGAAIAALALLVLFSIAIAANLLRGRAPGCHCFGQRHSTPVSGKTLARNGALAGLATLIAWPGPGDASASVGWIGDLRTGESVALIAVSALLMAVAVQGWLLLNLLRQNGRVLKRVDAVEAALGMTTAAALEQRAGLPVGAPAPDFALRATSGETVDLESLALDRKPVVLVFTDPACAPCAALRPEIGRWQHEHEDQLNFAVISRNDEHDQLEWVAEHDLRHVLLQDGTEVLDAYKAAGTPSAVVITSDAKIASRAAFGADSIRALVVEWTETGAMLDP